MITRSALTTYGQCAFCTFRASTQALPLLQRQDGSRRHRTTVPVVRKISRFNPRRKKVMPWASLPGQTIENEHRFRITKGGQHESVYSIFGEIVTKECKYTLLSMLRDWNAERRNVWGVESRAQFSKEIDKFQEKVDNAIRLAVDQNDVAKKSNPLFYSLREAYVKEHAFGLQNEIHFQFMTSLLKSNARGLKEASRPLQEQLADMRYPMEWYPATRALQRTIHLHVGPTNSGKTYHALQKLEAAKTGIYAGPLRLLAHEVYTRFNAKGKMCALITGEEQRIPKGLDVVMNACTVEMVPLNALVDVAVIDEIQMLADPDRGWAWTQALLGIMAKEVHLCGELRTIPLIEQLCAAMGDKLVIHRYERLGVLEPENRSLNGNLKKLQKGDAVILFSRLAIHAMKASIEKVKPGKRCAVVYGSLPPETRAQQAALFNDPNNDYDYLVASNAVGMGLNLSIKRVIFEATTKHDGTSHKRLQIPEVNQIAGRAGRFKTAHDAISTGTKGVGKVASSASIGYVTTLDSYDLPFVRKCMRSDVEPIEVAGIRPPNQLIARFAALFPPNTPLSYVILRLHDIAAVSSRFFLCHLKEIIPVADLIQPYKMPMMDRLTFLNAPISIREPGFMNVLVELAKCISDQTGGELLDLKSFPIELVDEEISQHPGGAKAYLREAEVLHKALTLYLWLSYRFAGVFRSQALAFHVKGLIEAKIDECLAGVHTYFKPKRHLETADEDDYLRQQMAGEAEKTLKMLGVGSEEPEQALEPGDTRVSGSNVQIPLEWEDRSPDDNATIS